MLTSVERVLRQWKEYYKELMNEENEREKEREIVQSRNSEQGDTKS